MYLVNKVWQVFSSVYVFCSIVLEIRKTILSMNVCPTFSNVDQSLPKFGKRWLNVWHFLLLRLSKFGQILALHRAGRMFGFLSYSPGSAACRERNHWPFVQRGKKGSSRSGVFFWFLDEFVSRKGEEEEQEEANAVHVFSIRSLVVKMINKNH